MAITAQRLDEAAPAAPSDDELLRQAQKGDADALRAIYEQHARAVAQRLFRLCGDEEIARDLTQDAFVIALRRIAEHRGDAGVATWLHGIAYNLLRDHRRTQRRRQGLWQRWFGAHAEPESGPGRGAAGVLEERQLLEQLDAALQALDEDKRDAFVLRVIEGLSLQDVSCMLGVPVSTVSYRARQAEARVRAYFGEGSA